MQYVEFSYDYNLGYVQTDSSDDALQMLGLFLTDELGPQSDDYEGWITETGAKPVHGNMICMDITSTEITIFYSDHVLPDGPRLSIRTESALKIIRGWSSIINESYQDIILKHEHGHYWYEGIGEKQTKPESWFTRMVRKFYR